MNEWTLLQELASLLPKLLRGMSEWDLNNPSSGCLFGGGYGFTSLLIRTSLTSAWMYIVPCFRPSLVLSLRASCPFGGYREKKTGERHARGGTVSPLARSLVRSRAACFARPNRRGCSKASLLYKGNNFLTTVLSTPLVCLNTTKPQFL